MVTRVLVCLAVLTMGCGDEVETAPTQPGEVPGERGYIRDQSGAVFGWLCDEERCELENIDQPLPDCHDGSRPAYIYTWGFIIKVAAACVDSEGSGWLPHWERFVTCEDDVDCPLVRGYGEETAYVCNAGLCKAADNPEYFGSLLDRIMMMSWCAGDDPRDLYDPDPWGAVEAAVLEACPGEDFNPPCLKVPEGCRDPRG